MKSFCIRLLICAALSAGLVSCVEVPNYPAYGGGYGGGYNRPYNHGYGGGGYNQGYYQGYNQGHYQGHVHQQQEKHHEVHCYCSHKSCGCKPGHPKGGCYCDNGAHRH